MRQETFPRGFVWRAVTALILALVSVPLSASPVAAQNLQDYFSFSFSEEFSKTEITGSEVFYVTVVVEATCSKDLPVPVSEAEITGRIVAEHQASGAKVTLNSSYTLTIKPFPNQEGETTLVSKTVPLQFPQGSQSGTYSVAGELIEARVKAILWLPVTAFLPPSRTLSSVTYVSGSGGGGGGGGGGEGLLPLQYRSARDGSTVDGTINAMGEVRETIKAASTDGKVIATILVGSYAKDKKGRPLSNLTMTVDKAPPPGTTIVGTAYNFKPDGATFEPPMTVVWSYDPEALPEGVLEGELHINQWDGSNWQQLESRVNTEDNTVSADVAHFTTFAILATLPPAPVAFTVSSLSVSPGEVDIGESVIVSVLVTNNNDSSDTHQVTLRIDNVVVSTKEITLEGGATQKVTFTTYSIVAGTYAVTIDGLSGTFVVRGPVAFATSDLSITPAEVDIGEGVTISALITNTGDVASSYKVTLKIDNVVVTTKKVTLEGGANQEVTFTTSGDVAGTYAVTIDGLSGTFVVRAPAAFVASDLSITPAEVDIGEGVTISALITNTGDVASSYKVTLKIDNVVVATKDITLAGGATQKVTFTTAKDVAGTYAVDVNGLPGTFTIKMPVPELTNWRLVGGTIAGVIVIGVLIWLAARRRT